MGALYNNVNEKTTGKMKNRKNPGRQPGIVKAMTEGRGKPEDQL